MRSFVFICGYYASYMPTVVTAKKDIRGFFAYGRLPVCLDIEHIYTVTAYLYLQIHLIAVFQQVSSNKSPGDRR